MVFLRIQNHVQAAKEKRDARKEQQRSTHAMQKRDHSWQGLFDFHQVKILGTFSLQSFAPWKRRVWHPKISVAAYFERYNLGKLTSKPCKNGFTFGFNQRQALDAAQIDSKRECFYSPEH